MSIATLTQMMRERPSERRKGSSKISEKKILQEITRIMASKWSCFWGRKISRFGNIALPKGRRGRNTGKRKQRKIPRILHFTRLPSVFSPNPLILPSKFSRKAGLSDIAFQGAGSVVVPVRFTGAIIIREERRQDRNRPLLKFV